MDSLIASDAVALVRAIRTRQVSAGETLDAFLGRIDAVNSRVNAIVAEGDRDVLRASARSIDDLLARGQDPGPLAGLPIGIKDLHSTSGLRTTMGSPLFADWVPAADSIAVGRIRAAGAIIVGKTNSPEFGLGSHTYNPVYGATGNAFDPTRSAGGSSGGAAVALALDMVPLTDGSDYGGSLRNPAGWNNVFGLRPSAGRVPAEGPGAFMASMGVVGPMARSVEDLGLLLSVQAGYHPAVPGALSEDPAQFAGPLDADVRGRRVAWGGDWNGQLPFEPGVLETCRAALSRFEALGCIVEEAVPDFSFERIWDAWLVLRGWQAGANLLAHYRRPEQRRLLKPEAVFEVESGLKLSAYDIAKATVTRQGWYEAVARFFGRYDYFLLPTAQCFPFPIEQHWPREIAGRTMSTYHQWMQVTLPNSLSGCPCLAAPAGFGPEGLPMGLQILGPNRSELDLLRLGHAYAQTLPFPIGARQTDKCEGRFSI